MPNSIIVYNEDTPALDAEIEWNLIRYKHMADDAEEAYKDLMARLKKAMEENGIIRHKVLGPGISGRGIPKGPRGTRMGTGLS